MTQSPPTATTYVRWRTDQPRERALPHRLQPDHPAVDHLCLLCELPLGTTADLIMIVLGADTPENQEKARAGRWHAASAVIVHTECANNPPPGVLPDLSMED